MFDIIGYRFIEWVKRNATNIKVFLTLSLFFLTLFIAVTRSHAFEPSILPTSDDVYYQLNYTYDDVNGDGDYLTYEIQYKESLIGDWQGGDCINPADYQDTLYTRGIIEDLTTPLEYDFRVIGYSDSFCNQFPETVFTKSTTLPAFAVPMPGFILDLSSGKSGATSTVTTVLPYAMGILASTFILLFIIKMFKTLISPPSSY